MRLPKLSGASASRSTVDVFGGYDHNLRIADGSWYDMENMSSDLYPVMSPRTPRGIVKKNCKILGMVSNNGLCYVEGSNFIRPNGTVVEMGLNNTTEKNLVSMGAFVVIMPDKKWINVTTGKYGDIEASFYAENAGYIIRQCWPDGSLFENVKQSETAPGEPANGDLWLDLSGDEPSLKQWSSSSKTWISIITNHVQIWAPGIEINFEKGDSFIGTFGGTSVGNKAALQTLGEIKNEKEGYCEFHCTLTIVDKGDNYIVVRGTLGALSTGGTGMIKLHRKMPDMDFVIESGNRLWGCKYGDTDNGFVNEIYASKLGDFKNWNCFMGISTDSWVGAVGSDGQFTGAITHLGYPLFFKENVLHKVYISGSGGHGIQDTACRGVQKGCERSLAIVNEVLYYKARHAVCAYDGSLPVEISSAMGDEYYGNAVAGAHGNKYYISMQNTTGQDYNLFVYDTAKGIWHREDETQVDAFCSCRDEMYFVDHADGSIKTVHGTGEKSADPVEWMVQTGPLGTGMPDMKYISRLTVRLSLEEEATADFYIQYDSIGQWDKLCTVEGTHLRSYAVPIRPRRCDHFRLRIQGQGDAKIYSMTKTIEQGSDYS